MNTVLLAVDEDEFADAIVDFVSRHNWPDDTAFTVVSVMEPVKIGNLMAVLPGPVLDDLEEARSKECKRVNERACARLAQALKGRGQVKPVVCEGFAREEILSLARTIEASCIVIGSHGKRIMRRMMLGSVSLAVVSQASCTVCVVHLD